MAARAERSRVVPSNPAGRRCIGGMRGAVLIGIAVLFGLTVAPALLVGGATAHACGQGDSCDGSNCPDDGDVHYHADDGKTCWAVPSPLEDLPINPPDRPI